MNDEQQFIIEDPDTKKTETLTVKRFWIVPHLLVLAVIMVGLFSTLIIPKTTALLQPASSPLMSNQDTTVPERNSVAVATLPEVALRASSVIVFDAATGQVLYEKNADEKLPLASITKLMTALVAYEVVDDDTKVTVSERAAAEQSGGTLRAGEVFEIKALADFSLVSSFNSAAYTLADAVGRLLGSHDPQTQFVVAMNIRASELGLDSLEFFNATGLDISSSQSGGYGTARDVASLVNYILNTHPAILSPTIKPTTRLYNSAGEYHDARNTNEILTDIPNVVGSKTGYTDLAGGNLVMAYNAGLDRPIIIVVLNSTRSGRFTDVYNLYDAVRQSLASLE